MTDRVALVASILKRQLRAAGAVNNYSAERNAREILDALRQADTLAKRNRANIGERLFIAFEWVMDRALKIAAYVLVIILLSALTR